jgi:hypothetical protein
MSEEGLGGSLKVAVAVLCRADAPWIGRCLCRLGELTCLKKDIAPLVGGYPEIWIANGFEDEDENDDEDG